jgi:hypothetical protein
MAEVTRSIPAAKIAAELIMIALLWTLSAMAMPMTEQLIAPIVSEAIGAKSDSTKAARISPGSSASVLRV